MRENKRLDQLLQNFTEGGPAGCALSVTKNNEQWYEGYFGYADLETRTLIEPETIYRIYSMTKIITCTAALMLYERGLYLLNDPLEEYLPEFKNQKVNQSTNNSQIHTIPASRPIQVKDLFLMTSGLTYQGEETEVERQVTKAMEELKKKGEAYDVRELSKALASIPLDFHPGTRWKYGLNHDVLGAFIEVVSGKRFGVFLKEEIFEPLGMKDTFFQIPEDKMARLCTLYNRAEDGSLTENNAMDSNFWPNATFESGGGGLLSTVFDYSRFAQMLASGGELDGNRIIGNNTIKLMATNHLDEQMLSNFGWNYQSGYGYGLGVRVMINPPLGGSNSSIGEFGWSGLAGTWVLIDPLKKLTAVYMQQMLPNFETYHQPRLRNVIYSLL